MTPLYLLPQTAAALGRRRAPSGPEWDMRASLRFRPAQDEITRRFDVLVPSPRFPQFRNDVGSVYEREAKQV